MNCLKKIIVPCLIILLMSCAVQSNKRPKIKQGVYGNVTWLEGNMMPSPETPTASNGQAVERTIYIYELTNLNQVIGQAPLYSAINTKFVKKVKTDKNGYYQFELPIGIYSLFTNEIGLGFFANSFNSQGQISTIDVTKAAVVRFDIVINYNASY